MATPDSHCQCVGGSRSHDNTDPWTSINENAKSCGLEDRIVRLQLSGPENEFGGQADRQLEMGVVDDSVGQFELRRVSGRFVENLGAE